MKKIFGFAPFAFDAIAIIRIIIGIYMVKYGFQVFDTKEMAGMGQWLGGEHHFPMPFFMAYLGKGAELVFGVFLILGLFTRLSTIFIIITMIVAIIVTGGNVFGKSETAFLYSLFALMFFFTGPGKLSLDYMFRNKRHKY